jgi:hypothetical protein
VFQTKVVENIRTHLMLSENFCVQLTSPTGGGRSVGIVRSRTKATELELVSCVVYEMR